MLRTEKSLLQNEVTERKRDKKESISHDYFGIFGRYKSRRKRMRYFRRQTIKLKFQMTVWDIGSAPSKGKREGEASYHKNLPASLSAGRRSFAGSRST